MLLNIGGTKLRKIANVPFQNAVGIHTQIEIGHYDLYTTYQKPSRKVRVMYAVTKTKTTQLTYSNSPLE